MGKSDIVAAEAEGEKPQKKIKVKEDGEKTETKVKVEADCDKPKKKVKVEVDGEKPKKEPVVKVEVQNKILAWMGQEIQVDRVDLKKQEVAEGCGFQKAGTKSFHYAWRDLQQNKQWIAKSPSEKGSFRLTEAGRDNMPTDVVLVSAKKDNAGKQEFFKAALLKQCKEAKQDKLDIIFDILKDGKLHSLDEFTKATGYANYKSKGLGYPLSHMEKKMKILEKIEKMYQFTDKCFPEGRP